MLRRVIGTGIVAGLAVGLAAVSGGVAAIAANRSGSTLGWRVSAVITRPKLVTLLTVDAIGKGAAWAGGCAATAVSKPGPGPAPPNLALIEHFNGRSWRRAVTPPKLHGCVRFIRSSSPRNVWAFGWNTTAKFSSSAFALHLVGGRWIVAHGWGPKIVDGGLPVGAAVLGSSNVWVFFEDNIIEHYNGHAWLRSSIPGENFLAGASTDSGGGVWVAGEFSGFVYHLRVVSGVAHWISSDTPLGPINGIYARTPDDVWVVGMRMAHFTSGTWHPVSVPGMRVLAGATSDGAGSLWLWRAWDNTGTPPAIERYSAGVLTPVEMPVRAGQRAGIFDIAPIPGTGSAWAVGAFLNKGALGSSTGVIMKAGP